MHLSIIVPCHDEESSVVLFYDTVSKTLDSLDVTTEFIFINDGSTDQTLQKLQQIQDQTQHRVIIIDLSRNFGKEAAMLAGLKNCMGDVAVIMDADLQDPPDLLPQMIHAIIIEGYDCVATFRKDRNSEPFVRSILANMFYRMWNVFSEIKMVSGARDYRMMTRPVVDALINLPEYNRFTKGLYEWLGYKTKYISFEHRERVAGKTNWSFIKLFSYAIEGILSFTITPLRFASLSGVLISFTAFIYMLWVFIKTLIWGDPVAGYPSMIVILLFISGIQLLCLGTMGEYIGRIYNESKHRPHFIIKSILKNYE